jgi:hypothetical protein
VVCLLAFISARGHFTLIAHGSLGERVGYDARHRNGSLACAGLRGVLDEFAPIS